MLVKDQARCPAFSSKDGCTIREIIHPANDPVGPGVSLALAEVPPGGATIRHRLGSVEIYYILAGRGLMRVDDESAEVGRGQAVHIPAGAVQWIENLGPEPLRFLCVCQPAYRPEGDTPA